MASPWANEGDILATDAMALDNARIAHTVRHQCKRAQRLSGAAGAGIGVCADAATWPAPPPSKESALGLGSPPRALWASLPPAGARCQARSWPECQISLTPHHHSRRSVVIRRLRSAGRPGPARRLPVAG